MSMLPVGIGGARSGGYEIEKSLRLRAAASAYLTRTMNAGNRTKWSYSLWFKKAQMGVTSNLLTTSYNFTASGNAFLFRLVNDALQVGDYTSASFVWQITTNAVLRDPSAHYHILFVYDTGNATSADRVQLYINGTRITSFSSSSMPSLSYNGYVNSAVSHNIGALSGTGGGPTQFTDGNISEINFIDGQALAPSDFGEFSAVTGQWVPKKYTGSYGTNGFYLDFKDGTSLTTLGYDKSGNSNNWTLNNISLTSGVTYDWMDDTPSNSFAVLNPLNISTIPAVLTNANLLLSRAPAGTNGTAIALSSIKIPSSGKWYWESTITQDSSSSYPMYGGISISTDVATSSVRGIAMRGSGSSNSARFYTDTTIDRTITPTYATGSVLQYAYDVDNAKLFVGIDGTWLESGDPEAGTNAQWSSVPALDWFAFAASYDTTTISASSNELNFGQRPFAYTPPTGFKALCTKNLPAPQVKNGADYFDVVLNTGANIKTACEALFGSFFEWIKDRANANNHQLIDSVRGDTAVLQSNTTAAETTYSAPSGNSVGWVWRIAAGFLDVVTYTGTGVARTVAHNLGAVPAMMIVKNRSAAGYGWLVYHHLNTAAPETDYLNLQSTAATADLLEAWNDTKPTSSELTVGSNGGVNANGNTYVAYLFAEVEGFSKFGSYTGNGSADGPFVYCGFKPKYVMIKCSSTTGDWWMYDAERSPANPAILKLLANSTAVEDVAGEDVDLLSNGFKIRSTAAGQNTNAATYVFAAFAECPFKYATAR